MLPVNTTTEKTVSIRQKDSKGRKYWVVDFGKDKTIHLGPVDDKEKVKSEKVEEALHYMKERVDNYFEKEFHLLSLLSPSYRQNLVSNLVEQYENRIKKISSLSPSAAKQYKPKGLAKAERETRHRQLEPDIESQLEFSEEIRISINNPHASLYLGKTSCSIFSEYVEFRFEFNDLLKLPAIPETKNALEFFRKLEEVGIEIDWVSSISLPIEWVKKILKEIFEDLYSSHKSKPSFNRDIEDSVETIYTIYANFLFIKPTKEKVLEVMAKMMGIKKEDLQLALSEGRWDHLKNISGISIKLDDKENLANLEKQPKKKKNL